METLYAAFDSRLTGDSVKIGALAYAPATVSPLTPRDIDHINEAVLRLLRILVARHAAQVDPAIEEKLFGEDALKLPDIATAIRWLPDCQSEITQEGIGIEPYEQELIQFWDDNRIDIESIEQEISKLWKFAFPPATSAAGILRNAIARLRSTADGLRSRETTTISRPDANALSAHFARLDAFAERVPDLFKERVEFDGDARRDYCRG